MSQDPNNERLFVILIKHRQIEKISDCDKIIEDIHTFMLVLIVWYNYTFTSGYMSTYTFNCSYINENI